MKSLQRIERYGPSRLEVQTIDITFDKSQGTKGLLAALDRICAEACTAMRWLFPSLSYLIVISSRSNGDQRLSRLRCCAPSPVANHERTRIGIVLETGEAREVHHHCLLTGYGADAINPYVAFEALWQAKADNLLDATVYPSDNSIVDAYKKAVAKGMLKVMAKMGISTLQSYKGAQIFEAVGLAEDIIRPLFCRHSQPRTGLNFDVCSKKCYSGMNWLSPASANLIPVLPNPGDIPLAQDGDAHMWDPTRLPTYRSQSHQYADAYANLPTRQ